MPLYDFTCPACGHQEKDRLTRISETEVECPQCQAQMKKDLTAHSGYSIKGNNGASERPKQAGSFKGSKG
jgi:putative FmdB family regulatory protein